MVEYNGGAVQTGQEALTGHISPVTITYTAGWTSTVVLFSTATCSLVMLRRRRRSRGTPAEAHSAPPAPSLL